MIETTQQLVLFTEAKDVRSNFYLGLPSGYALDQKAEYLNISLNHAISFFKKTTSEVKKEHKKALKGMTVHFKKFLSLAPSVKAKAQCSLYRETHFMSFWPWYMRIAFPLDDSDSIVVMHYQYFDGNNGTYEDEARFSMFLEISNMKTINLIGCDKVELRDNFFSDIGSIQPLLVKPLIFSYYAVADLNEFDHPERKLSWCTCREITSDLKKLIKGLTAKLKCQYAGLKKVVDDPGGCYLTVQKY